MRDRPSFPIFAGAVGFGLMIPPPAGLFFVLLSALCIVAACVLEAKRLYANRRDPYDLRTLLEVHEGGKDQVEEPEEEYDSILCMNCSAVYKIAMPLCPKCGAPPGLGGGGCCR